MTSSDLDNPLDQEREASMADEGGASGAEMETQSMLAHPSSDAPVGGGFETKLGDVSQINPDVAIDSPREKLKTGLRSGLLVTACVLLGAYFYKKRYSGPDLDESQQAA